MVRSYDQSRDSSESDSEDEMSVKSSEDDKNVDDNDSDYDFDADQKASSSTRIVASEDVKADLVEQLSKLPIANMSYTKALKKIKWDEISVEESTTDELQAQLKEIIKSAGFIRTLGEILSAYKKNGKKFNANNHPDLPKKPLNAHLLYTRENKDKLMSKYLKENPEGTKFLYHQWAIKRFSSLPATKQEPYRERYVAAYAKYKQDLKKFYAANPTLKPVSSKNSKREYKPTVVTPFGEFRNTLTNGETFAVAQKMWRDMDKDKKCEFIRIAVNKKTDLEKKISDNEYKLLEHEGSNGMPKKPMAAYSQFLRAYSKKFKGDRKNFVKLAAVEWKKMPEAKKKVFVDNYQREMNEYPIKLREFIDTLPKEKQQEMLQRYRKDLKRKNSQNETTLEVEPPKKKKKKDREESPVKVKVSQSYDETDEEEEEPVEKKKKKKKDKESPEKDVEQLMKELNGGSSQESPKKKKNSDESSQESSKKKKNGESALETPRKKKKTSESSQESPRKLVIDESPLESPKKKKKNDETSLESPRKIKKSCESSQEPPKKIKPAESSQESTKKSFKTVVSTDSDSDEEIFASKKKSNPNEPEYPSQSTAHYFMVKIFKGKKKDIADTYKDLSKQMKKKYFTEMKKEKEKFLTFCGQHMKKIDAKEVAALKLKWNAAKQQQKKELSWHKDRGTDDESNQRDSSSDDDSDSS